MFLLFCKANSLQYIRGECVLVVYDFAKAGILYFHNDQDDDGGFGVVQGGLLLGYVNVVRTVV